MLEVGGAGGRGEEGERQARTGGAPAAEAVVSRSSEGPTGRLWEG